MTLNMYKIFLATSFLALSAGTALAQTTSQSTPIPDGALDKAPAEETVSEAPEDVDFVFSEAPNDHVIGSEDAPITMIMHASVTCGHCGRWFQDEWPMVKRKLVDTGKIRFILRPLPTPPAKLSVAGFLMAECAPEEDYFSSIEYQMNNQDAIFEAAKSGSVREEYRKVAELSGLKTDEDINACLSDPENMDHLRLNGRRADAAGVKGVPAFYIGGQAYKGKQQGAVIVPIIESMYDSGQSTLPESVLEEASTEEHNHDHE